MEIFARMRRGGEKGFRITLCLVWMMGVFSASASDETYGEPFDSDPLAHGWKTAGAADLFRWDSVSGQLHVTWDSSRANSYFYRELPRPLTTRDDFGARWDMRASRIEAGVDPEKTGTFQMAAGFLSVADALDPEFVRGSGTGSPNILEWNYFPDTGFGETFSSAVVASNGVFQSAMQFPFPMRLGEWHHVELRYESLLRRVSLVVTSPSLGRLVVGPLTLSGRFSGFRVDAFAISSYSDEGQDPEYGGSILAEAVVDNVEIQYPAEDVLRILGIRQRSGFWRVRLVFRAGETYRLMRSADLNQWMEVARVTAGESGESELEDPETAATGTGRFFYRVERGNP